MDQCIKGVPDEEESDFRARCRGQGVEGRGVSRCEDGERGEERKDCGCVYEV